MDIEKQMNSEFYCNPIESLDYIELVAKELIRRLEKLSFDIHGRQLEEYSSKEEKFNEIYQRCDDIQNLAHIIEQNIWGATRRHLRNGTEKD